MGLPKYLGSDCELSTSGLRRAGKPLLQWDVAQRVLDHVGAKFQQVGGSMPWSAREVWGRQRDDGDSHGYGYGQGSVGAYGSFDAYAGSPCSTDCRRTWTSNGHSYYCDLSHVEVCTPACLSPRSFAAHRIAALRIAEAARRAAEAAEEPGSRLSLSTSNVDASDCSISWGTHLSVSVTPELWSELCGVLNRPAVLGFVSSALAAAIPFFGTGHILPFLDGRRIYSLSARAHHLSRITSVLTTEAWKRGMINTRHEPHGEGQERLHLIGFDHSLASAALKASFVQCCLAAAENGFCQLLLRNPVKAMRRWSWGLNLESGKLPGTAQLVDGSRMTLYVYLREVCIALMDMLDAGRITEEIAPEAREMLARILDLTLRAEKGDLAACGRHLDWASKLLYLREMDLPLGDARLRLADHDFTNTDPDRGAFWKLWSAGVIDPLVNGRDVDRAILEAPPESRDWGRAAMIARFPDEIVDVDWSYVKFRSDDDRWGRHWRVDLPRLNSLNKQTFEKVIETIRSTRELVQLVEERGLTRTTTVESALEVDDELLGPEPDLPGESGSFTSEE